MGTRVWKVKYLRLVRRVHRILRHRRLRHLEWWKPIAARLLDRRLWQPCRDTVAGGISIGLFFAMMPMPFQTIAAAAVSARARVNVPFAVVSCFVSNPLTEPFIRLSQLRLGGWLRALDLPMPRLGQVNITLRGELVTLNVADFILGFMVSGILLGLLAYPLVHLFSAVLPQLLPIRSPLLRARAARRRKRAN